MCVLDQPTGDSVWAHWCLHTQPSGARGSETDWCHCGCECRLRPSDWHRSAPMLWLHYAHTPNGTSLTHTLPHPHGTSWHVKNNFPILKNFEKKINCRCIECNILRVCIKFHEVTCINHGDTECESVAPLCCSLSGGMTLRVLQVCVCVFVCLCVCGSVTTITRNCLHRSSPNWVYRSR